MTETKQFDWTYAMRIGLLAGVVTLYTGVVGMMELFNGREVVREVFSLGQVLVVLSSIVAGYMIARQMAGPGQTGLSVVSGLIVGFFSALPSVLLILITILIDVQPMFVNVTDGLIAILTFNQASLRIGSVFLIIVLTVSGLLGSIIVSIPEKLQRALVTSLIWLLGAGIMSELINQVLKQFLDRATLRLIFNSNTLRLWPAIYLFIAIFVISLSWSYFGPSFRRGINNLSASGQRSLQSGGYGVLFFVLILLPWILGTYLSEVMVLIGLYVLMGLGLNIAIGLAGLLDLGYVTNFAVGAYVMAILTSTGPLGLAARTDVDVVNVVNFWLVLPVSILCALFTGFILALPVLKMRGDYLAIATLGFGEIIRLLALSNWLKPLIGGAQGVLFIPKPKIYVGHWLTPNVASMLSIEEGYFEFSGPQQLYFIIFAACLLMLFISIRINNSRTGRQWMAMREDEDVAAAMGIDTTIAKLLAFTLSAASGGLAGAIFATKLGTIFPHSFNLLISINALSLIIVGGMGSIPGIVVGAIVLIGLPELLREFSEFRLLLYGALLVTMMLVRPEGLWPSAVTRRELQQTPDEAMSH